MGKRKVEEIVAEIAAPIVDQKGYELVDVEFIKETGNWYLRVYIDKPEGINIDDCQSVSELLSEKLDKTDPIEQSYFLEVSSPGLERPLKKEKEFVKYKGEEVEVKLYKPLNGQKIYEGKLVGLMDNKVCIIYNGKEMFFERDQVAIVKRVLKF